MSESVRPISILMLSPHPSIRGGVTDYVATLTAHLRHSRVVFMPVGRREDQSENGLQTLMRILALPLRVAARVRRESFDVVHINPSLDPKSLVRDGLILLALRLISYRRVLVFWHGWRTDCADWIQHHAFARRLFIGLLNGTARVMVLAPAFRNHLVAMGVDPSRLVVTSTMFDTRAFSDRLAPATPRRTILFLSRLVPGKGADLLIDAFASLAADTPDLDLVIAGDGPSMADLRHRVETLGLQTRVQFLGHVSGAVKMDALTSCTLFALPTRYAEGMPIALLEAMAAGKPVLTSKAGGIGTILRDGDHGVILDDVTVDSVAGGLRFLLSDPESCARIGAGNKTYAWSAFEATVVTARIESAYHAIAEERIGVEAR